MAQANDAHGFAGDLAAAEHGLVLLHFLAGSAGCAQGFHVVHAPDDVAAAKQEARDHQLLHRVGVSARGVEDRNPGGGHFVHWHVVGTGAAAGNGAHRPWHFAHLQLVAEERSSNTTKDNQEADQ